MKNTFAVLALLFASAVFSVAQEVALPPAPAPEITGLYTFLHEGEFMQIEVSGGKVTGLVSLFKNGDPDSSEFEDQYFDEASLKGSALTFTTKPTGGLWFGFSGTVERGSSKTPDEDGYWILRGTVTEYRSKPDGKTTQKTHSVSLKSFPQDKALDEVSGGAVQKE